MNLDMKVNYNHYHIYLLEQLANAERLIFNATDPERKEELKAIMQHVKDKAVGAMEMLKELNLPYEHFQSIVEMCTAFQHVKFK